MIQDEIRNIKKLMKEIELLIKTTSFKGNYRPDSFPGEFYQTFKENNNTNLT